jgi:hypothetical protein
MEEKLYARIGRMQLTAEAQDEAYTALLKVLAGVVSGEIDRKRVLVNLTDRTWQTTEPGQRPALPATINGIPLCVVAPD